MKPFFLAAGAGIATATVLLLVRRAQAVTTPPSDPGGHDPDLAQPTLYGEQTVVTLPIPYGWRRATGAEVSALPELVSEAIVLRNTSGFSSMQYGSIFPFTASDGKLYATWIEQHYHPPGGTALPWGYHHGVTVLARA
jgi:hypothetical protein